MSYPDSEKCPQWAALSIQRWVDYGITPGDFLTAVLNNDLREAIFRADENSLENITHIVAYLYNCVPSVCWGSIEKVNNWKGRLNE